MLQVILPMSLLVLKYDFFHHFDLLEHLFEIVYRYTLLMLTVALFGEVGAGFGADWVFFPGEN